MATTFNYYTPRPEGDWVKYRIQVELSGSHALSKEINDFIKATGRLKAGIEDPMIEAVREPSNPHDTHAVFVQASWAQSTWKLGYLPRENAFDLSKSYAAAMPLAASLTWVRYAGDGVYVKVQFWIPGVKLRRANSWQIT